jgi:ABC-type branched-subunit amino acid transport system substrate-binding protein
MKGLQALDIRAPVYSIEIDASAVVSAGTASEGITFIRPAAPDDKFNQTFRAMWKVDPDIPASQCYDAIMILSRAIVAGVSDKESFATYFKSFPSYVGASGTISITNGKTLMSTDLFRVASGQIKRVQSIDGGEQN